MNRIRKLESPLGLGIPTILCIFAVLMMCALSLLTYLKTENLRNTVEREIDYATAYYRADSKAKYILSENKDDQKLEIALGDGRILLVERTGGIICEYRVVEGEK